tara:strand:+ start:5473 stop:5949 length:477 start_codon:yes stop_codon:yes gene_type:complete
MKKFTTLVIIFLAVIAGYIFFLKTFDKMPPNYKILKKSELELKYKHESLISKLADDSQTNKRELASEYLQDSKIWILELTELIDNYKILGKGLSMRKRSQLAGEALEIRNQIKLIEQTQIMLKNALDGKVSPEHKKLLNFDKDKAYRKIFKNIPSKKI